MNVCYRINRSQWKLGIIIFFSFLSTLYVTKKRAQQGTLAQITTKKPIQSDEARDTVPYQLLYSCPPVQRNGTSENVSTARLENKLWYESGNLRIANVSSYLESFRHIEYDNWGHTYEEVKSAMYSWKSQYFKDVKSNDIIYESACGLGMNLYMTLEILQQLSGVTNITVYGNDYVSRSISIAREIFNHSDRLPSSFGHAGSICEADSTQLDFVPSNVFDLVFTGYISPLIDPLQMNKSSNDENYVQYISYCEHHHQGSSLSDEALQSQRKQNDWYGKWVGEMIRIAKPGAPIIIEQVSYPLCDAIFDWGGVAPRFWKEAIKIYNWEINRSSIEMKADSLFRKRYHVYMRKKGLRPKTNVDA